MDMSGITRAQGHLGTDKRTTYLIKYVKGYDKISNVIFEGHNKLQMNITLKIF